MGHLVRNPYAAEEDRISDMLVFIAAGHETTAWTVTWLLLEVTRHPEVKKKLLAELDSAIPSAARRGLQEDGTGVAFPAMSELMALPYLNMCIREAMRLWPVSASGE